MKSTTRILLTAALVFAVGSTAAYAAGPYEERLGNDIARTMGGADERIPDDVEAAYWRCWAGAWVYSQVSPADLRKLDAGDRPTVDAWGKRVEKVLMDPSGDANAHIEGVMAERCPQAVDKLRSYL